MATSLELYELLKKHLHEEAARVIAEAIPPIEQLATKADIQGLKAEIEGVKAATRADIEGLKAATRADIEGLKGEIYRVEAAMYRWMLTFLATLMLGMGGMITAIVLKA